MSLHWGTEYVTAPTAFQRSVARRLARSDSVDVILGHHAHVVQPSERIHETWASTAMGNSLSGMTSPETRDGLLVQIHVERRGERVRITGVRYAPTWAQPERHLMQLKLKVVNVPPFPFPPRLLPSRGPPPHHFKERE